jgi:hypothetical protein
MAVPSKLLSMSFKTVTPAQPASFLFKIESDVGRGVEYIDVVVHLIYPGGSGRNSQTAHCVSGV